MARKYRPQSFDQMVGQNHITQTINNALKNDRLPHALLFTGLRGTGKTSSARILAKTLRCTDLQNFTPCHKCSSCVEITLSRSIDVIEIDGASNNGVDAIRDLRDNVMFSPSSGKYKIFIIDEVHMLSTSAFNALLKTLEEPPAHVIFILATTEAHKIPQTILSRCQRFDFRRIPLKQVSEYLQKICTLENITADLNALWLIAKQGDGSMRDSLSLLDQVISFTNSNLTEAEVSQVLGLTERTLVLAIFEALLFRQASEVVSSLEKLSISGQNPSLFLEDLAKLVRHSLLLKTDATATDLIDLPEDEISQLILKISKTSYSDLHMLFDMLLKSMQELKYSDDAQIVFEVALLRMVHAPRVQDLKNMMLGSSAVAAPNTEAAVNMSAKTTATGFVAPTKAITEAARPKPHEEPKAPHDIKNDDWLHFVQKLKSKDAFFGAQIEKLLFQGCEKLNITLQPPQSIAFLAAQMQNAEFNQKLQGYIDSELSQGYTFLVLKSTAQATGESASTLATQKGVKADEVLMTKWQNDSRVKKALEVFKGEIKLIKKSD